MMNCPKCASENLVETPALGNIPLDVCPGCSGIWFDKGELEALLQQSQGGGQADLGLINPKPAGMNCPRCDSPMERGGLVNQLLLVDKCGYCGGVWLDPHELDLVKKLLGLTGGPSEVKVERAAAPAAPVVADSKGSTLKLVSGICAVTGLIGLSFELYLYFIPAESVAYAPSAVLTALSFVLFAGGIFGLSRD